MTESSKKEIARVFELQHEHQKNLRATTYKERKAKLKKLLKAVYNRTDEIEEALYKDFRKSPSEAKLIEIYNLVREIKHAIRHLKEWMAPEQVYPAITFIGSKNRILFEPKGVVLVISPWNYPFLLAMNPIVSAVAAGNCVILKPSSKTPHTSKLLKSLLADVFEENEIAVFEGSGKTANLLLAHNFDHVFFTGGIEVGKSVMKSAADNLTCITLELGGKSPAIVDSTANLHEAAQNIIWGKFMNAGQTCVAPDYVLVNEKDESELLIQMEKAINKFYGDHNNIDEKSGICNVVDAKHSARLKALIKNAVKLGAEIKIGNTKNSKGNFISPIVLTGVKADAQILKEEIFGPVLPLLTYKDEEDILKQVSNNPHPLAMYVFSKRKKFVNKMITNIPAGGVTVNGVGTHFANSNLPFGGINNSGMGKYHGYHGFKELSNQKAMMKLPKYNALKLLYPPYNK
ncbi:aldehyde dehydrogenase family protein, partial [Bacteroidota bacterium]